MSKRGHEETGTFCFSWRLGGSRRLWLAADPIARLAYDLYGLTEEEIRIVEGAGGPAGK